MEIIKMSNQVIGYLRVSKGIQDADNQKLGVLETAHKHNLSHSLQIVKETVSGTVSYKERKLKSVVDQLNKGDTLIVSELSRLGRSMLEVITILIGLTKKKVNVLVVKNDIKIDDSINSKIYITVLSLAAEIERELISSRTKEALALKKSKGFKLGRPVGSFGKSKLDAKKDEVKRLHDKKVNVANLAKIFDCSWSTMNNFVKDKIKG